MSAGNRRATLMMEVDVDEHRAGLPIGSRLRILPDHACLTAAAHPGCFLLKGGRPTGAYWERCNRW
jgi:D-serine deaminase-like pyridoxal phosphate-dependent protein